AGADAPGLLLRRAGLLQLLRGHGHGDHHPHDDGGRADGLPAGGRRFGRRFGSCQRVSGVREQGPRPRDRYRTGRSRAGMTMSVISGTLTSTMTMATPLLLAALGENVVQKAGVVNVGLEGMMLVGAFAATIGAKLSGDPFVGIAVAAAAGLLMALLFAAFAIKLTANQVVIGVVLNLFALGLTGTLYRKLFGETGTFVTTRSLPRVLGDLTLLTPLAALAVPAVWWGLNRTRRGLEFRACGEQPVAAEAAGVNVARTRTTALLFGGAMAGIAGGFL